MSKLIPFSFELFPPNTFASNEKLCATIATLRTLNPDFFSVTCGAGGASTQSLTTYWIEKLISEKIAAAPHITGINLSKTSMNALLKHYRSKGVTRLVVIRGDTPLSSEDHSHQSKADFLHAVDLVRYIRAVSDNYFKIYVAAYPEFHPESDSIDTELRYFKEKMDAGANAAITQYFFSPDAYYRYCENCARLGIHAPIIPGIMPITQYEKLARFSARCQAEIPRWLARRLQTYQQDGESLQKFGVDVITTLCQNLISAGATRLHFYTLNSAEACVKIIGNLYGWIDTKIQHSSATIHNQFAL